jgi:transcription initiation factor IIE alpha subunit
MNREKLIENYAVYLLDNMDRQDVLDLAYIALRKNLNEMTDEELMEEVTYTAPDLLEESL